MNSSPLRGLRALISGAGVAGPALACALAEYGAEVTVVEIAAALRGSGFPVDFRGPTHLRVLERLGILDELRRVQTHGGAMTCVDERDREIFTLPAEFTGGDLEVHRSDLSHLLYQRSQPRTEYLFGDAVTGLADTGDGMRVTFARSGSRDFDLVIGADGLHSAVRRHAFGPEERYVRHLGYHIAGWSLPNDFDATSTARHFAVPGRMASVSADHRNPARATALMIFASPPLDVDWHETDQQKKLIQDAYAGMPWHVPHLLNTLSDAPELYFDSISKVRVPQWHTGRVALLGDAAWGVTLGGMGVGTGVVGAYVLAGELAVANGDHRIAYPAYERRMRQYADRWQRGAHPGKFLAPGTGWGLWLRNSMFRTSLFRRMLISGSASMATDAGLPEYR
ncbi:FAD-dependent monooxygenase [Rugosimonospora acidiphila]|uniref:FAD-dependent monooxygenase n=1 Tax=Rugosimonospora acidiphila TaxID=556531 RepID=A0ABP9RTA6_9ACTN